MSPVNSQLSGGENTKLPLAHQHYTLLPPSSPGGGAISPRQQRAKEALPQAEAREGQMAGLWAVAAR